MALKGLKVIEFAGLAPGPFAGLILADNGASVTRIDRPFATSSDVLCRGKRSIAIDSKLPSGRKLLEEMISSADVLIDPFRPGVLERLGLGPELFLGDATRKGLNERLVYARIVGFPRTGPHKDMAGHDINYLALSGVLSILPGTGEKPVFPLNLLGDFAGGGAMCAMGVLLALIERGKTGRGQIVNADMVSGTRFVSSFALIHAFLGNDYLSGPRGTNALDGGAPYYNIYTCKDGRWMSVGCLEPQFYKIFIEKFRDGLPQDFAACGGWIPDMSTQFKRDEWPKLAEFLREGFLTQPRDFWANLFHGTDACAVPILSSEEAGKYSSHIPAFHPRVSKPIHSGANEVHIVPGTHTDEILSDFGISRERVLELRKERVFGEFVRHASQSKL